MGATWGKRRRGEEDTTSTDVQGSTSPSPVRLWESIAARSHTGAASRQVRDGPLDPHTTRLETGTGKRPRAQQTAAVAQLGLRRRPPSRCGADRPAASVPTESLTVIGKTNTRLMQTRRGTRYRVSAGARRHRLRLAGAGGRAPTWPRLALEGQWCSPKGHAQKRRQRQRRQRWTEMRQHRRRRRIQLQRTGRMRKPDKQRQRQRSGRR